MTFAFAIVHNFTGYSWYLQNGVCLFILNSSSKLTLACKNVSFNISVEPFFILPWNRIICQPYKYLQKLPK